MPIDGPGELTIGIRARLCHLLQPQIHPHPHERGYQFQLLFPDQGISTRQVGKVAEESGPVIDFQQQISKRQMRQQRIDTLLQALNFFWDRFFE